MICPCPASFAFRHDEVDVVQTRTMLRRDKRVDDQVLTSRFPRASRSTAQQQEFEIRKGFNRLVRGKEISCEDSHAYVFPRYVAARPDTAQ